jgi:tetrahedral aminopeptidase
VKELIKKLTEAYGPSGQEAGVRELITAEVRPYADEIRTDVMGNLIVLKKPSLSTSASTSAVGGKRVMIAAHMDEIGLIVTHVDEKGFVRFAPIGGVNPVSLIGGRVVFADGLRGVIGSEKREGPAEEVKIEKLFIDVGAADRAAAESLVAVGDLCGFDRSFVELGGRLVAKAMDDRVGCAVMIRALRELGKSPNEISFVFTVQEEVGLRGATTSAYSVHPDVAIALDVTTTGDTPECRVMPVSLGKGPAVKVKDRGMLAHAGLKNLLVQTAKANGIPHQLEVMDVGTTDGMAMQMSREGVPTGVLSVPTRFVHTPSEMVDLADVTNTVRLLVAFLQAPIIL